MTTTLTVVEIPKRPLWVIAGVLLSALVGWVAYAAESTTAVPTGIPTGQTQVLDEGTAGR